MAKLFGTNGVRGIFGEGLTLEFISEITLSIATLFKKGPILVGYDGRESSVIISKIVTAALSSSGLRFFSLWFGSYAMFAVCYKTSWI